MVQALGSRGKMTQDILFNLFKGYAACSDRVFVLYADKKQDKYDEGNELNPDELMNLADNKFKKNLLRGNGTRRRRRRKRSSLSRRRSMP